MSNVKAHSGKIGLRRRRRKSGAVVSSTAVTTGLLLCRYRISIAIAELYHTGATSKNGRLIGKDAMAYTGAGQLLACNALAPNRTTAGQTAFYKQKDAASAGR